MTELTEYTQSQQHKVSRCNMEQTYDVVIRNDIFHESLLF